MARIRTIKPEFFTSEDVVELSPLARLFYIGLWCEADREGRLSWRPKTLKLRYLPGDDCDLDSLTGELTDSGMVHLYEVDGVKYAEIPSFTRHQVINNREAESEIPARVAHASARVKDACTRVKAEGKEGREGKEGNDASRDAKPDGLFPDVDPKIVNDFKRLRASKKAPITETAVDGIRREAAKAGVTLEAALRTCCERGWTGFKAEWVAGQGGAPSKASLPGGGRREL